MKTPCKWWRQAKQAGRDGVVLFSYDIDVVSCYCEREKLTSTRIATTVPHRFISYKSFFFLCLRIFMKSIDPTFYVADVAFRNEWRKATVKGYPAENGDKSGCD